MKISIDIDGDFRYYITCRWSREINKKRQVMREWLSWWSTTLPRWGSRVRVPSRALLILIRKPLFYKGFRIFLSSKFTTFNGRLWATSSKVAILLGFLEKLSFNSFSSVFASSGVLPYKASILSNAFCKYCLLLKV